MKLAIPTDVPATGPLTEEQAKLLRTAISTFESEATDIEKQHTKLKKQVDDGELLTSEKAIEAALASGTVFDKKRFVGLQQQNEKLTGELDTIKGDAASSKTLLETLKADKDALTTQLTNTTKAITEKDGTLQQTSGELARLKLLVTKHPSLVQFEADGLLPAGTDPEALEPLFIKFEERIGDLGESARKEFVKGGGGGGATGKKDLEPGPAAGTSAALLKEANAAIAKGDVVAYTERYDAYVAKKAEEEAASE